MQCTILKPFLHGKLAAGEHGKHRSVLRKHFRLEPRHAFFSSDVNQVFKYASRDPDTRALKTFAVDLTANPDLAAILQQVRGQQVELSVQEFNPYRAATVTAGSTIAKVELPPVTKVSGTLVGDWRVNRPSRIRRTICRWCMRRGMRP